MKNFFASNHPSAGTATLIVPTLLLLGATGCLRLKQPEAAPAATQVHYMNTTADHSTPAIQPTTQSNAVFEVDGKPFCFEGTNNYYLNRKSKVMVDDLFARAKRLGLKVVRTWAFIDRGSLDGSVAAVDQSSSVEGTIEGYYTQYWDPAARQPAYNDGANGLEMLDYAVSAAQQAGIKLMLELTNNWRTYGGMDQYLTWYGLSKHHQFFTDERVRTAYKNWAAHLIGRKNTITGLLYRDDPTIFAWELANEPRIRNDTNFDSPDGWDLSTITRWADEMTQSIKALDPNHLVAVGDEGMFANGKKHDLYSGKDGIDHKALLALKGVDFGTFHLYPDNWSTGLKWSYPWVSDHIKAARAANKPTILEEYGLRMQRAPGAGLDPGKPTGGEKRRLEAYRVWNDLMLLEGGAGSLFWMLSGTQDDGSMYPDYDHYAVYEGESSGDLMKEYATRYLSEARSCWLAPAADNPERFSPFVSVRRLVRADSPRTSRLEVFGAAGSDGWVFMSPT